MTQFERMKKGLIYDPGDPEILEAQTVYKRKLRGLLLAPGDQKSFRSICAKSSPNAETAAI